MITTEKTIKYLLQLALWSLMTLGQAQNKDFQTRLGAGVSGSISDALDWEVVLQERWVYNSSHYERTLIQGGFSYELLPFLDITTAYRKSFVNRLEGNAEAKNRILLGGTLSHKVERLKLSWRTRGEYDWEQATATTFDSEFTWRNKAMLKYDTFGFPVKPYLSAELFMPLNSNTTNLPDGVRYKGGADVLLTSKLSLDIYYFLDKELNAANPSSDYILGMSLSYTL